LRLPQLSEEEEQAIVAIEMEFKERTRHESMDSGEKSREMARQLLVEHARRERAYMDDEQLDYLAKMATLHLFGAGFLDELLQDERIEEISIIGVGKPAYVYIREKGWQQVNACFTEEKAIMEAINKLAQSMGRRITLQMPRLDAMLKDGSRLHASLPPLSHGEITIRKFRLRPYSPVELGTNGTANQQVLAILSLIMQSDQNLLIAGNTASGKTSLLNALFSFVPLDERVLITEETPEINIPHPQQIRLVANREMGVTLRDLVYDSLRMRPDRMIVGEVRNREEAEALFDVLHGGQARGTYATLHAQSAREAERRLQRMDIEEWKTIDWLVVQRRMMRWQKGGRKEIRRIVEVMSPSLGEHWLQYSMMHDRWEERKSNALKERWCEAVSMTPREWERAVAERTTWMKKAKPEFFSCFQNIQKKWYGLNYAGTP